MKVLTHPHGLLICGVPSSLTVMWSSLAIWPEMYDYDRGIRMYCRLHSFNLIGCSALKSTRQRFSWLVIK